MLTLWTTCPQTIYANEEIEHLEPMDISLSEYNDSDIQALGSCIIPLVSQVNSKMYDIKFHISNYNSRVLFSCQDSIYMQLESPIQLSPITHLMMLSSSAVYMIDSTLTLSWATSKQLKIEPSKRVHVPASQLTMPLVQALPIGDTELKP